MTFTTTTTFTRTHAKHLAAKVIADLYQCSVLYDHPDAARMSSTGEITQQIAGALERGEDGRVGFDE